MSMSESHSAVTPVEVVLDANIGPHREFWVLLGLCLPWAGGIPGYLIAAEIAGPCSSFLCGLDNGFPGLAGGYFVGWLASAVAALSTRSAQGRAKNFLGTVLGAAALPASYALLVVFTWSLVSLTQ